MSDKHNADDIWETDDSPWKLPDDDSWELPDDFVPLPYENIPEVTPTYFDAIGGRTGEGKGFVIGLRALIGALESGYLPSYQDEVFLKDLHPCFSSPAASVIVFSLLSILFLLAIVAIETIYALVIIYAFLPLPSIFRWLYVFGASCAALYAYYELGKPLNAFKLNTTYIPLKVSRIWNVILIAVGVVNMLISVGLLVFSFWFVIQWFMLIYERIKLL